MSVPRAVFLDRDGVLNRPKIFNRKPFAPKTVKEFAIYDGVREALLRLKSLNFLLIVVTNQPDIGNGSVKLRDVQIMHEKLQTALPIDHVEMCPHSQNANCECRKPKPGMLVRAAKCFSIDCQRSWLVGDRVSDIEAGLAANVRPIFIDRNYAETKGPIKAIRTAFDLAEAVQFIVDNA